MILAHSCIMSVFFSLPLASIQFLMASHYFSSITMYLPLSSNIPLISSLPYNYLILSIVSVVVSLNLWAKSSSKDNLFFLSVARKFFSISYFLFRSTYSLYFDLPSSSTLNIPFHLSYSAFFFFSSSSANILQQSSYLSLFSSSRRSFYSYYCSFFSLLFFSYSSICSKASFLCFFSFAFSSFLNCLLRSYNVTIYPYSPDSSSPLEFGYSSRL